MLDLAAPHILRRSIESWSSQPLNNVTPLPAGLEDGTKHNIDVSTTAVFIIGFTVLTFLVFLASLRYTLWMLLTTLAAVEDPQTVLAIDNTPKPNSDSADLEIAHTKKFAITSSIRGTLRHLTERAGWASRWRGLSLFICYSIVYSMLNLLTTAALGQYLGDFFGAVIASLALARWGTAWVHIVISEPSAKSWLRRIPGWKATRNVALPTFVSLLAGKAVFYTMYLMTYIYNPDTFVDSARTSPFLLLAKLLSIWAVMLVVFVTVALPASVALYRVQASMLPEEDESIIPFDRSFGGKVAPAITGGSGALTFADAWKSFDSATRNRMLKLIGKLIAIEFGVNIFFGLIIALQAVILIGTKNIKEIPAPPQ